MPYPWFDFVSPEFLAGSGRVELNSIRDRVVAKVGSLKLKLGVIQKVKKWWRRRGLVEVKPNVGGRGIGVLG